MAAIIFPPWLAFEKSEVIGPVRLWLGNYISGGAEPASENIQSVGELTNDGIEFDHKVTYAHAEIQQLTAALRTAMTKQEFDLKFTVHHLRPQLLPWLLGQTYDSYGEVIDAGGGGDPAVTGLGLGEPFDITEANPAPNVAPNYWQAIFQFPSPSYDFTTSPKAQYAYLRLFKAAVISHGPIKFSKTGFCTLQCTMKGFVDMSVTGQNKIGQIAFFAPTV